MKYASLIKHGEGRKGVESAEFRIWIDMHHRCSCPTASVYRYYGGKGVKVCERWNEFTNFLDDMGRRPSDDHSIDRKDSSGDYEPSNCRWATKQEQMRNKGDNRRLTLNGQTRCVVEWAEVLGISVYTIRRRLNLGYTDSQALKQGKYSTRWRV